MEKELLKRLINAIKACEIDNPLNMPIVLEDAKDEAYEKSAVYREYCDAFTAAEELLKA